MAERNSEELTLVWKTRESAWLGDDSVTRRFSSQVDPLDVVGEEELARVMGDIHEKASGKGHDVEAGWTADKQAAGLSCAKCRKGTLLRIINKELEIRGKFYEQSCRK